MLDVSPDGEPEKIETKVDTSFKTIATKIVQKTIFKNISIPYIIVDYLKDTNTESLI